MKKFSLVATIVLVAALVAVLCACNSSVLCDHSFDNGWVTTQNASCTAEGVMLRSCSKCGYSETRSIDALGHQPVVDPAVEAACGVEGRTEGQHCGVCNEILVAQIITPSDPHTPVIDPAVPATCTTAGLTQGTHCTTCGAVIHEQTEVAATGHKYDNGVVVSQASCTKSGTRKFTCTVAGCGHSYTSNYTLPTYSATEISNMATKYVGEIVVYDKSGAELGLATCFVITSDGRIVTNYHVIEDAYSAKVTINGSTYNVTYVLAYDATIDLAVLKINASGLTAANVCKQPVQVGETVYAIGSSRGLTNTFSQGIVTYANRVVDGVSHVQHDASITNGNSGGPLINVYGEVIGINTWGLTDSQNLNFAVFTGELDKLKYGSSMTLAQFYEKNSNAFVKMKNYIMQNGTYLSSDNCYRLLLGTSYASDGTKYTRLAYYYASDNVITLDFLIDDGEIWAYFEIDSAVDGSYFYAYFDDYGNKMQGTINGSTFSSNILLGYSYNNINDSSLRASVRELVSSMLHVLCTYIDSDFAKIGVDAGDLGFVNY